MGHLKWTLQRQYNAFKDLFRSANLLSTLYFLTFPKMNVKLIDSPPKSRTYLRNETIYYTVKYIKHQRNEAQSNATTQYNKTATQSYVP
jgi:hypothetical protein